MKWRDTKVMFEPWLGNEYDSGIVGRRVLILGESHYHDCADDSVCKDCAKRDDYHRRLTPTVVNGWCEGDRRSPLSYRVPGLFGLEPREFWRKVVFYNYVQGIVAKKPRVRQKDELWTEKNNAEAFQTILDCYRPQRILVLGKKLWTNLPSDEGPLNGKPPRPEYNLTVSNNIGSYNKVDECCYWYESRSGIPALAMPIMHPSAPRFQLDQWRQPVAGWLNYAQ